MLYNLEHIGSVQQKQQRTEYAALWDTHNSRSSGLVFADVDCLGPASDEGFNPGQDCTADTKRRVKAVKKNDMVGQQYQKQLTCLVDPAVSHCRYMLLAGCLTRS